MTKNRPDPSHAGAAAELPLEGLTVVSLEQAVAAPLATRHLADLGARVVKVERVGDGDFARDYDSAVLGLAAHFVWLNRGKESFAVDLKSPAGIDAVTSLIAGADVFLQNLAPGAAERARGEQAQFDHYVKSVATNGGAASEIDKAKRLLDEGTITQDEFNALKAKALAA